MSRPVAAGARPVFGLPDRCCAARLPRPKPSGVVDGRSPVTVAGPCRIRTGFPDSPRAIGVPRVVAEAILASDRQNRQLDEFLNSASETPTGAMPRSCMLLAPLEARACQPMRSLPLDVHRGERLEEMKYADARSIVIKRARRRRSPRLGPQIVVVGTNTVVLALGTSAAPAAASADSASGPQTAQAAAIAQIVRSAMQTNSLKAVIVKVTKGDQVVAEQAFGSSMSGVPATTAMHFRNGAVVFAYIGTLLLKFVEAHKVNINDTIERWEPTLPEANQVTLKMLTSST